MNPALPRTRVCIKKQLYYEKYSADLAKLKFKFGITKKGRAG